MASASDPYRKDGWSLMARAAAQRADLIARSNGPLGGRFVVSRR
jgi:hypothetical protein